MAVAVAIEAGPDLTKLRKQYKDWASAKDAEAKEARLARHYYHGDQWTEAELRVLRKRRQPAVTYNRVSRKVDGVIGLLERLRQDPKAFPRTPKHEDGAELATAVMRYAIDAAQMEDKEGEIVRDAAIEGIGVAELILVSGDRGDPEIDVEIVDGDEFFYDPRSFREDFSDARFMGTAKWMHVDDLKDMAPDKSEEIEGLISSGGDFASLHEQDKDKVWVNVEKKHVRVAMHWYRERGQWVWCFYTADLVLATGHSPWFDEKGNTICGLVAFSAYVDHDGDRYGFVRNLKSPQDEINMRRSKALHQLNTRRIISEKGSVDNVEKARLEAARPDGFIEVQRGFRFEFDDAAKSAEMQGQVALLEEAKAEIENFGPNPALLGQGVEAKSGRAIALLQQAGVAELGPFMKAYRGWKLRLYRAIWCAVQRHWSSERWIRVTDDDGLAQFIQINGLQMDEWGQPQLVNAIGSLSVDIILDEAPDTVNTMQDVFELLESLAAAGVPVPPQVVIEMSALPSSTKKRVITMIEQAAVADPADEQAKRIGLEQESSKTAMNKARALKDFSGAMKTLGEVGVMPSQQVQQQQPAEFPI